MISAPVPGIILPINASPGGQSYRLIQGYFSNPNNHYTTLYGLKGHGGYDIAPPTPGQHGCPLYAPHDGILTYADFGSKGLGKHATIVDARTGRMSVLGHLSQFMSIPNGSWVHERDQVGIMGMTGDATGIHVHYEFKHVDLAGNALNKDNGYGGCIEIGQYTNLWMASILCPAGT